MGLVEWFRPARCLLTVRMVNLEALRLAGCLPQDESDGVFGYSCEFPVSDVMLAKPLDDFDADHLEPALFAAWEDRQPPDTDRPLSLPRNCDADINEHGDLISRTIRMYRTGTDQDVLRIDIRRGGWT
jgi:hypothetical protein